MEKYTANPMNPSLLYRAMALPRMDTSYKIDEGYSEETRSQDELDSPMRLDPSAEGMVSTSMRLAMDSIMSLSEEGKSGMTYALESFLMRLTERWTRIHIQRIANASNLLHSQYCRETATAFA